jgi:butyryl-CoA dehydrogenase
VGKTDLGEYATALRATAERIGAVTAALWAPGDVEGALANATVYLEAVGHAVVAWLWLEQALAADGKEGAFYDGKRAAARYFFRWELPKTGPQLDLLASLDRTTLDARPEWL